MRGSRILKWGVNFCNNVREPINILGIKKTKKGAQKKKVGGEIHPFHLPWIRAWCGTVQQGGSKVVPASKSE